MEDNPVYTVNSDVYNSTRYLTVSTHDGPVRKGDGEFFDTGLVKVKFHFDGRGVDINITPEHALELALALTYFAKEAQGD